jgi:hypothetical protein
MCHSAAVPTELLCQLYIKNSTTQTLKDLLPQIKKKYTIKGTGTAVISHTFFGSAEFDSLSAC